MPEKAKKKNRLKAGGQPSREICTMPVLVELWSIAWEQVTHKISNMRVILKDIRGLEDIKRRDKGEKGERRGERSKRERE